MSDDRQIDVVEASRALATVAEEMSIEQVEQRVNKLHEVMRRLMKPGTHYGKIPGVDKDTLLLPGAQLLDMTFRFAPQYETKRNDLLGGHREYEIVCTLIHVPTGTVVGQGVGSCSTMESKYRYRNASRKCPVCAQDTIIKGKDEYGGGWLCYAKKGGCGAKFKDGDTAIEGQAIGKVENPDIADVHNTVLKMAAKRALVAATITACAASDVWTQDMEDFSDADLLAGRAAMAQEVTKAETPKAEKPSARAEALYKQLDAKITALMGKGIVSDATLKRGRTNMEAHKADAESLTGALKALQLREAEVARKQVTAPVHDEPGEPPEDSADVPFEDDPLPDVEGEAEDAREEPTTREGEPLSDKQIGIF